MDFEMWSHVINSISKFDKKLSLVIRLIANNSKYHIFKDRLGKLFDPSSDFLLVASKSREKMATSICDSSLTLLSDKNHQIVCASPEKIRFDLTLVNET